MTTWEVQKPYSHGEIQSIWPDYPETVDRYTAVIDDKAIGRFDTSDEAHEAIIQELVKRLSKVYDFFKELKKDVDEVNALGLLGISSQNQDDFLTGYSSAIEMFTKILFGEHS